MLLVRWRPSGGRGEYEYIAGGHVVSGKKISIKVPGLATVFSTDVRFAFVDGKPRLRRKDPNLRSILNVPPLVAALGGLPSPRRADTTHVLTLPLQDNGYVASTIGFDVVSNSSSVVVLEPIYLRPLHGGVVDFADRLDALAAIRSGDANIEEFFRLLTKGENNLAFAAAASKAHQFHPVLVDRDDHSGDPSLDEDEIVQSYTGKEGKETIRTHRHKERDPKLVRIAKKLFRKRYGSLFCECCGFGFEEIYGDLGRDLIEAHHSVPISSLSGEVEVTPDDLELVCPNCHRMVHRTAECSLAAVRKLLRRRPEILNLKNLAKLKR